MTCATDTAKETMLGWSHRGSSRSDHIDPHRQSAEVAAHSDQSTSLPPSFPIASSRTVDISFLAPIRYLSHERRSQWVKRQPARETDLQIQRRVRPSDYVVPCAAMRSRFLWLR